MNCPRCDYHSPFEQVRCPHCFSTFEAAVLEELGHLKYLRDRLSAWRTIGTMAPTVANPALAATEERIAALETRLGLRSTPAIAPPPAQPVQPTPPAASAAPLVIAEPPAPPRPAPVAAPPTLTPPPAIPAIATTPLPPREPSPAQDVPPLPPRRREAIVAASPPIMPPPAPSAPRPPRPAFSWAQVGSYLLSERTLNGLLSLGAFLILASGTVISTINPTKLGPIAHFASTVITTLLFYLAGLLVRQKLALPRTGAVLLAIGAAFMPLSIWTLGQELLHWDRDAIWLAAALICLPLYLGSHLLLRDRTFALLTALAGGAEVYTVLAWLQVPLEWRLCALLLLAIRYLTLGVRLDERWPALAWALRWTAQVATPAILAATLLGRAVPLTWTVASGAEPTLLFRTAVAVAWWLGAAYYVLCARRLTWRGYPYVAAWSLPAALLLTLAETPLAQAWHNVALALLALTALAWGRWRQRALAEQARPSLIAILTQPAYQLALALPVVAILWPWQDHTSRIATLYVVALVAILAARLFRHPALRYAGTYLPAVAVGLSIDELRVQGVPGFSASWQNLSVAALALAYLLVGWFILRVGRQRPVGYATVIAEPAYQVALWATVIAGLWPAQTLASRVPTLFAVVGVYALAAWLFRLTVPRAIAAYLLPLAVGYGLQLADRTPALAGLADWHGAAWALLAGGYLLFARFALRSGRADDGTYRYPAVAREPVWHMIPLLTAVALLAPQATATSRLVATLLPAVVYGAATFLLRQRAWAWPAVAALPLAAVPLLDLLRPAADVAPLAWACLAVALLVGGEVAVRRTGEARRDLLDTLTGLGGWRSRFAAPLFATGYGVGLLALTLALARYDRAPLAAFSGGHYLPLPLLATFVLLVAALVASTATRRASFFLYPASALAILPYTAGAALLARHWGLALADPDLARLLALLGAGYLACALATDRAGVRFAAPLWLAGYALAALMPLLIAADRTATVQTLGLLIVLLAASAWLAHRDRHPAFAAFVNFLDPDPLNPEDRTLAALFVYAATWLFPLWALLTLSLWAPATAVYGFALALLAPSYVLLGVYFGAIRPVYRWPWYLCGYTLAVLGPVFAFPDSTLRIVALAISLGLWIGSAAVSRRAAWLYPVATLTPALVWEIGARLELDPRYAGLVLLLLSLAYSAIGMVLHRGWRHPFGPVSGSLSRHAWPFFGTGQALALLGLALSTIQQRPLLGAGFALGALGYVGLAWGFRQPAFGWPAAIAATVAYVSLTLTALPDRHQGLGLLPLLFVALIVADLLRRRLDDADPTNAARQWEARLLGAWATPWYALAYGGTVAVIALSVRDTGILALACWGVAAIYALSTALFRHPLALYPALGAALAALVVTTHTLAPGLTTAELLALLIVPAWFLVAIADAVAGARDAAGREATPRLWPLLGAERLLGDPWATPPLAAAFGALIIATLGGAGEAGAGLLAALPATILLAIVATRWRGEVEGWGALALGAVAFEQFLLLVRTPLAAQAPRWALLALALSVVAIGVRALGAATLDPWRRPLAFGSIGFAAGALLLGLACGVLPGGQQPLAITLALTGLTLVAHGFDRREHRLGYAGVACLGAGYLIQLLIFEIGQPQAFVLPVGLYLLAVAYLEWRRGTGTGIKPSLEIAALSLMLTVSAIQALGFLGGGHDRHLYGSLMVLQAVALFGLGAALRWRRTFFGGALGLVVAVGILLKDPVRELSTWYLIAIIGFAMIALVVFIEQRRQQIPVWLGAWRARLEEWD